MAFRGIEHISTQQDVPPNALAPIFSVSSISCVFGPHEDGNIIRLVESLSVLFISISTIYSVLYDTFHAIYTHVNPSDPSCWIANVETNFINSLVVQSLSSFTFSSFGVLAHAIRTSCYLVLRTLLSTLSSTVPSWRCYLN